MLCLNKLSPYLACRPAKAGVCSIIFARCDAVFNVCIEPEDPCFFRIIDNINGELSAGQTDNYKVFRCNSDSTSYSNYTLKIIDYNTYSNYNSDMYSFITNNYTDYKIGWITGEGLLYGWYNFTMGKTLNIQNDAKMLASHNIAINFVVGRGSLNIIPHTAAWLDYIVSNQNYDCNAAELITSENLECSE